MRYIEATYGDGPVRHDVSAIRGDSVDIICWPRDRQLDWTAFQPDLSEADIQLDGKTVGVAELVDHDSGKRLIHAVIPSNEVPTDATPFTVRAATLDGRWRVYVSGIVQMIQLST